MSNTYLYILDYKFIKDYIILSKTDNKHKKELYNYLPLILNSDFNIDDLTNKQILIYLKSNSGVSGFYGYLDITEIIKNNDEIYNKLITHFKICIIPNFYFIKYDSIHKFDKITTFNNYKSLCKMNGKTINEFNFKINKFNVYEYQINNVIKLLEKEEEKDDIDEDNEDDVDEDNEEDVDEDNEEDAENDNENNSNSDIDENENKNSIIMDIPILWIPCHTLLSKIENNEISKKIIIEHYSKCISCEIIDNNKLSLEFNKKINFQIIENSSLIDNIIDSYQNTNKYIEDESIFNKIDLLQDNINIIYYKYDNELYNNCLFIVKK